MDLRQQLEASLEFERTGRVLPAVEHPRRPRSVFEIFVSGGYEALTRAVSKGDPIKDLDDLTALMNRGDAFSRMLRARLAAQGMAELMEPEDDR